MGSTPAFGSLAAGVPERVRSVLERENPVNENLPIGSWFKAADFVPWWTGLEPLISELHILSKRVRQQR